MTLFFILIPHFFFVSNINIDTSPHAIYISVIEIEHKANSTEAMVLIKTFSDDLHNAVLNAASVEDLKNASQLCSYRSEVTDYFNDHFLISFDDKHSRLHPVNCTEITDSHWIEFRIDCPAKWRTVDITADFFMELFPTQSNMITIIDEEQRNFYRTTKSNATFKAILR